MSAEWIVTFDIRFPRKEDSSNVRGLANIFHFKSNTRDDEYGQGHPSVFGVRATTILEIRSNVNGNLRHKIHIPLELNIKTHIEIHQRYVSKGNYRYSVIKEGQEVFSIINNDARPVYNTRVYGSNPWKLASVAMLSNLEFTNFL